MKHFPYPDIGQFRQAIRNVTSRVRYVGKDENGEAIYDGARPLPKIKYRGTCKAHGTNFGLIYNLHTKEVQFQSREQIITPEKDNAGAATFASKLPVEYLVSKIDGLFTSPFFFGDYSVEDSEDDSEKNVVQIFAEFCGGNIQKGVAITGLPKMVIIFSIKYCGIWVPDEFMKDVRIPEMNVFNVLDFPYHDIEIDFQNPEMSQAKMGDLCIAVENECPIGKSFGVSGVGEGLVFKPIEKAYLSSKFWFKVKGTKHSVSKVKTLAAVDVEKVKTISEFIDKVVTENRLAQGVEVLKRNGVAEIEHKHIGDFIRWVYNDVIKEEKDTLLASGLEEKDLGGPVAKKAKEWLFKNYLS